MSYQNIRRHDIIFQPAAVGSAETKDIINCKKGDRVLAVHIEKQILAAGSTTSTISVGILGTLAGFLAATDTETGAVGDLVDGGGASLLTNAGGYLFTADGTVKVDYVIGATPGATNPRVRVIVLIAHASGM